MGRLHEVATNTKQVVNRTVNGQKLLNLSGGFKTAHVAFALTGRLMGDLSAIIGILCGIVMNRGE